MVSQLEISREKWSEVETSRGKCLEIGISREKCSEVEGLERERGFNRKVKRK